MNHLLGDRLGRSSRRRKIAIVTLDFVGPEKNGGIGTAYASLADELVRAGHSVSVVFANPSSATGKAEIAFWRRHYRKKGIELLGLPETPVSLEWDAGQYFGFGAALSYSVYLFLKEQSFDIIHFPENGGLGYYSLLAKKTGIAFRNTLFCVIVHSPMIWQQEYNRMLPSGVESLQLAYLERRSAELSDVVVGPSRYALQWVRSRGWKLPARAFVEQYVWPESETRPSPGGSDRRPGGFDEIVFFGRIEPRKGTEIFCEALNRLPAGFLRGKKIVFLGGFAVNVSPWSQNRFAKLLEGARFDWRMIRNYDRGQAIRYLKSRNALAVIPSQSETLGYTVMECIQHSIPFIASDIPAFRELVDVRDQREVLFTNRPEALRETLVRVELEGLRTRIRFAVPESRTRSHWLEWHARVELKEQAAGGAPKGARRRAARPPITVCLLHRDQPRFLEQSLRSLAAQTYRGFDVIVCDDASESEAARRFMDRIEPSLRKRGWRLLRLPERLGPSEARNRAVRAARGGYVMFMDADNVAKPEELEIFSSVVARTGADIVTCLWDRFEGNAYPRTGRRRLSRWLATGDDLATGIFYNVFGDVNAVIRRKTFLKLGGFRSLDQAGHEDWELFARATLHGASLMVVPEALFWYRRHSSSLSSRIDPYESARLHLSAFSKGRISPEQEALLGASFMIQRQWRDVQERVTADRKQADYARILFDAGNSYSKPLFLAENPGDFSKIRLVDPPGGGIAALRSREGWRIPASSGLWLELPPLELPERDLLVELIVNSPVAGALRISYDAVEEGGLVRREVVRSVQMGGNKVHALLDARGIRGRIRISPLDRKALCTIGRIAVYDEP